MRYELILLLGLIVMGCSAKKQMLGKVDNSDQISSLTDSLVISESIISDSLYTFVCDSITRKVFENNFNRAYFPVDLRRCLASKAFDGNREAEIQLATIIRVAGIDGFLLFGWNSDNYKFRGPIVFEAILEVSDNDAIYTDHDGIKSTMVTRGVRFLINKGMAMVKSIDGLSPDDFMQAKYSDNPEFKYISIDESILVKFNKYYYKSVVEAWESGKIVLKDYGEG